MTRTLAILLLLVATAEAGEPYRPLEPDTVVERLPRALSIARAISAPTQTPEQALATAREWVALGRRSGDPRYFGHAAVVLEPLLAMPEPTATTRLLHAHLLQAEHRFDAALDQLQIVLAAHPAHVEARLTRAVIHKVRGEPQAALRDCRHLVGRAGLLLTSACAATALSHTAQASAAARLLERALHQNTDAEDPRVRAWAFSVLGDLYRGIGATDRASAAFARALRESPEDVRVLSRYADHLLDLGQHRRVVELLTGHEAVLPLAVTLAIARRGLDSAAAQDASRVERMLELERRRGDALHLREAASAYLALFDRPDTALELALENWQSQRESIDARLVIEAAARSGAVDAAAPVVAWIRQQGIEDARLDAALADLDRGRTDV